MIIMENTLKIDKTAKMFLTSLDCIACPNSIFVFHRIPEKALEDAIPESALFDNYLPISLVFHYYSSKRSLFQ